MSNNSTTQYQQVNTIFIFVTFFGIFISTNSFFFLFIVCWRLCLRWSDTCLFRCLCWCQKMLHSPGRKKTPVRLSSLWSQWMILLYSFLFFSFSLLDCSFFRIFTLISTFLSILSGDHKLDSLSPDISALSDKPTRLGPRRASVLFIYLIFMLFF